MDVAMNPGTCWPVVSLHPFALSKVSTAALTCHSRFLLQFLAIYIPYSFWKLTEFRGTNVLQKFYGGSAGQKVTHLHWVECQDCGTRPQDQNGENRLSAWRLLANIFGSRQETRGDCPAWMLRRELTPRSKTSNVLQKSHNGKKINAMEHSLPWEA
jgi:hypothetical protein